MQPRQSVFQALRMITSGMIAGALIAAVFGQVLEPRNPGNLLLAGCLIGSAAGLLASLRRNA